MSGNLCGVLSAENSPYYAVDFLTVPDSCTLTIEPGVKLYLNEYQLYIHGQLITNGTASDSIQFINGAIVAENSSPLNFEYVKYTSYFDENAGQIAKEIKKNSESYCKDNYWGDVLLS